MLLGLLADDEAVAIGVLDALGVRVAALRHALPTHLDEGPS
ncbi:Clp protease N-terminal domain-containing protein [Streptomyces sp. NPDC048639]